MDILLTGQAYSTIAGATAFVLTALHTVFSFPVFFRMSETYRNTSTSMRGLAGFLFLGMIMQASWLVYLWPLHNLFLQIGICLQLLSSLVFLIQMIFILYKNKR